MWPRPNPGRCRNGVPVTSGTLFGVATQTDSTATTMAAAGNMAPVIGITTMATAAMVTTMATAARVMMMATAVGAKRTLLAIRDRAKLWRCAVIARGRGLFEPPLAASVW